MSELPPPPDDAAKIKMLEWRASAAETALLGIVEQYRETLAHWGPIAMQFVELNKRFPITPPTQQDTDRMTFDVLRADPSYASLTDEQLNKLIKDLKK